MNIVTIDKNKIPPRGNAFSKNPELYMYIFATEGRYVEVDLDKFSVLKLVKIDDDKGGK